MFADPMFRAAGLAMLLNFSGAASAFNYSMIDDFSAPRAWEGSGITGSATARLSYESNAARLTMQLTNPGQVSFWKDYRMEREPGGIGLLADIKVNALSSNGYAYVGWWLGTDDQYRYKANIQVYANSIGYTVKRYSLNNSTSGVVMMEGLLDDSGSNLGRTVKVGVGGNDGTIYFYCNNAGLMEVRPAFAFNNLIQGTTTSLWWGIAAENTGNATTDINVDILFDNMQSVTPNCTSNCGITGP